MVLNFYNGRTSSTNADNLIVRYMRMRAGRQVSGSDNIDAGGAAYGHDQIYDHCSFTWGQMNVFHLTMTNSQRDFITLHYKIQY